MVGKNSVFRCSHNALKGSVVLSYQAVRQPAVIAALQKVLLLCRILHSTEIFLENVPDEWVPGEALLDIMSC